MLEDKYGLVGYGKEDDEFNPDEHEAIGRMEDEKAKKLQNAVLLMKSKFGKNSIVRGLSLQEGAMTMERNREIGGHKA